MRFKKRNIIIIVAVLAVLVVVASVGVYSIFAPAMDKGRTLTIFVDGDDDIDSVRVSIDGGMDALPARGFAMLCKLCGLSPRTGHYVVTRADNAFSVYRKLSHGLQQPVRLVVPSVRTVGQLSARLSQQLMLDSATVAEALGDTAVCSRYGFTPQTVMAMFVPNTYEVYWNMSVEKLLSRMLSEYDAFWNEDRCRRAAALGLSQLEVSILASIVDEETAVNDEKPTIAALYVNRLRRSMPLQADPTVKFAVGDFTLRRILHKHLAVESPYNTYLNVGLPPGPIRNPSVSAIDAVLAGERNTYLYMCAKEDFSGRHNFASTLSQHNANAARYRRALDRRGIR